MTDVSLAQAIAALRANDRPAARTLLARLREQQPQQVEPWLWSAAASDEAAEKRAFLERALTIEPNNARTQAALHALGGSATQTEPPAEAAPTVKAAEKAPPRRRPEPPAQSPLAAPRFAPTGVRTRRAVPWTLIALIVALLALIPLTLWLI